MLPIPDANVHNGRQGKTPDVIERGVMGYCLNMGIMAHLYRQSLLEDFYSVELTRKVPQRVV